MRIACHAALLTALASMAHATTTSISIVTPFGVGGDFALGEEENQGTALPTFTGATSVLVTVDATLTWSEPFISIPSPGPTETVQTSATIDVFDFGGDYLALGQCANSSCAPTVQQSTGTDGITETDTFAFSFPDDPSLYTDPANPRTLFFRVGAAATCTGCLVQYEDDVSGSLSGTITTTFDPPAPVPEPSGLAILLCGAAAIVVGRRGHMRLQTARAAIGGRGGRLPPPFHIS